MRIDWPIALFFTLDVLLLLCIWLRGYIAGAQIVYSCFVRLLKTIFFFVSSVVFQCERGSRIDTTREIIKTYQANHINRPRILLFECSRTIFVSFLRCFMEFHLNCVVFFFRTISRIYLYLFIFDSHIIPWRMIVTHLQYLRARDQHFFHWIQWHSWIYRRKIDQKKKTLYNRAYSTQINFTLNEKRMNGIWWSADEISINDNAQCHAYAAIRHKYNFEFFFFSSLCCISLLFCGFRFRWFRSRLVFAFSIYGI